MTPILCSLYGTEGYEIYTDALESDIGCVLLQFGKVIVYGAHKLNVHERNYLIHDLELAAVIFTLKLWRHYLYGVKIDIFTEHKSLKYLLNQKELNMRQQSNSEFLAQEGYSNFAIKSEADSEIEIMMMVHGDNFGLVLPPKVAEVQIIVIPMFDKNADIEAIFIACSSTVQTL
ncbi:hypothetical protein KSP39_PZI022111 [Platanthera zijinensis]|uniref:Reverse transcriptase RNase H-like domain-containing protein n=1 Tax=Platanthera zijinensis TaxID=2320716 RepID=A0AAP0AYY8_9ASPA